MVGRRGRTMQGDVAQIFSSETPASQRAEMSLNGLIGGDRTENISGLLHCFFVHPHLQESVEIFQAVSRGS